MNTIEAMKRALEVLDYEYRHCNRYYPELCRAIEALEQVIPQEEQKKWVGLSMDEDDECACVADRAHPREDFYEWMQSYRKAVEAKLKEFNE
jgi:hypothetical protein